MSDRSSFRPPKKSGSSSQYRTHFVNPHPLPSQDEFRLDHIVTKVLRNDSKTVSNSLLKVCSNYQQDLKGEIRKVLAFEQKIQNKNIHATKRTHKLTKQWQDKKKALAKVNFGESGNASKVSGLSRRKKGSLGDEIDGLLAQSVEVSSNVKNLALRMAEVSKKMGISGPPDQEKYPKLNKLMGDLDTQSHPASVNGVHAQKTDANMDANGSIQERQNKMHSDSVPLAKGNLPNSSGSHFFPRDHVASIVHESSKRSSENALESEALPKSSNGDSSESGSGNQPSPSFDDASLDNASFEHFMDISIAKYRKKKDSRNSFSGTPFHGPGLYGFSNKTPSDHVPRNPIRLLSSGSLGSVGLSVKSLPVIHTEDPSKYSFLPPKSTATVYENPEMSLHKKLRIRTLPSPSKSSAVPKCECQSITVVSGQNGENGTSSKNQDFHRAKRADSVSEGELWSSSEAPTEAEAEAETESDDLDLSSSSDEGSSSESLDGQIGETNSYYKQFQSTQKRKSRHRRRHQQRQSRVKEEAMSLRSEPSSSLSLSASASPTPKHQPSHRVLQPKQSILKMRKSACEKLRKNTTNPPEESVNFDTESAVGTAMYTASPRGSFVNDCAVKGVILQKTEITGEGEVDKRSMHEGRGNGENAVSESVPAPKTADCLSRAMENEGPRESQMHVSAGIPQGADDSASQSQAVDMLRNLML